MTGIETTSLTLQTAALISSTLIGIGQTAVFRWGIRAMVGASAERAQAVAEDRQERAQVMDRQLVQRNP